MMNNRLELMLVNPTIDCVSIAAECLFIHLTQTGDTNDDISDIANSRPRAMWHRLNALLAWPGDNTLSIPDYDERERLRALDDSLAIAADCILNGFDWRSTPEGKDFWTREYRFLCEIARHQARV